MPVATNTFQMLFYCTLKNIRFSNCDVKGLLLILRGALRASVSPFWGEFYAGCYKHFSNAFLLFELRRYSLNGEVFE